MLIDGTEDAEVGDGHHGQLGIWRRGSDVEGGDAAGSTAHHVASGWARATLWTPRRRWLPPLALTLIAIVAGHVYFWPSRPIDIDAYLLPWLGHIREHGQIGAFAIPFSNYNPPYLYLLSFASSFSGLVDDVTLIKLLSVAGTLALSLSVWRLLAACGAGPTLRWSLCCRSIRPS